ncbi:glycerate kinase [Rhizobium sp. CFBP 8762]|uniref:glycerate kinase type-2 family protein n=1 Tax=Rhizobium sp. CFBP 8762 TaxID=2775279 RepID=UPI00178197BC|nr:glycerate kinase [Rhizobium sp. CFBP 8762]MBD8554567.1 glycerate kinase [Rhizobium sp. CFBP 8762]
MTWSDQHARDTLRHIFDAAVESASPRLAVFNHLPEKPKGRCVVVGAGKASAAMAAALDAAWPDVDVSGLVVTRYGHAVSAGRISVLGASHPVPDAKSEEAASLILQAVHGLTADDLVIALMSGGGSALMVAPAGNMTLADKQAVNRSLLSSGATIGEMNVVRKHLSRIKGGRLGHAAQPARLVTLVISDVPGDDPAWVASGPTVSSASTLEDARSIVSRYDIRLPEAASAVLHDITKKPDAEDYVGEVHIVAAPSLALDAAADAAIKAGLRPLILGDALEGEARELGIVMAGIAKSVKAKGVPVDAPAVLLSGGEATVTIRNGSAGRGGRNTEFLLSLAVALNGHSGIWALAGDSDGIDGSEDAAGALITPDTLRRGTDMGLHARTYLSAHDSYTFFDATDDLVRTGPTLTNVNDIRAVLVV